jgi:recombination associated protein RdgC
MWFKNLQIFRLPENWPMTAEELNSLLAAQGFVPCTSAELNSIGWVPPLDDGELVHSVGRQMLLTLRTEKKLLPSSVINTVAKEKAKELEEQQGFPPGKKAMKELKERVADELLPRAFAIASNTSVWIDPVNGWLVIDTSSATKADDVVKLLLKAIDKLPLESLRVQQSPVASMTAWIQENEAPHGFTIDQDAVMRSTGESRAQIGYKNHSLDPVDMQRHIAAGKQCTSLGLTWESKISFVLSESLAIKKITPLDVIREGDPNLGADKRERFDIDMTLMTGELSKMLSSIVEALGGHAKA